LTFKFPLQNKRSRGQPMLWLWLAIYHQLIEHPYSRSS